MTPEQIRAAIAASPDLQALVPDTEALSAAMSQGMTSVRSRIVSARGLAELYPGGPVGAEAVLMKLEGAATVLAGDADPQKKVLGSLIARQLRFLAGDGLDFGSGALRAMLDQFTALGVLTQNEVDGLKSIGVAPSTLTPSAIRKAIYDTAGNLLV